MAQLNFNISLTPREAYNLLQDFESAELVYDDLKVLEKENILPL